MAETMSRTTVEELQRQLEEVTAALKEIEIVVARMEKIIVDYKSGSASGIETNSDFLDALTRARAIAKEQDIGEKDIAEEIRKYRAGQCCASRYSDHTRQRTP